jgi:small-conductance mechanosensitive channel
LVALLFTGAIPLAALAQEATPAATPAAGIPTAPVEFDDRILFTVRGTSSLPAGERAASIVARIAAVARNRSISPDEIVIEPSPLGLVIRAGKEMLVTLVPADADLEAVRLETLGASHRTRIQRAIVQYRVDRAPERLLRSAALSLLATSIFAALLFLVRLAFRKLVALLERRVGSHIEDLPRGAFQFVQGRQIWDVMTATVRGVRLIGFLILTYLWLQFVLGEFPWTRSLSEGLLDLLISPLARIADGFIDFVPNLLFLLVLVVVTRYGLKLLKLFFAAVERGTATVAGFEPEWALPAYKIVRTFAIALALVMAYPYLPGSGSEALQGISVFAGLMFSLGASAAVSNVIAGYLQTFGRVLRVGDVIKVGEVMGTVTQVRLLTTRIRTIKNEEVTVPNAVFLSSSLVNYTSLAASDGLVLHTEVRINYETPWRQVHAMLEEAARRTPGLMPGKTPFILQRSLGDFAVVYELNVHVGAPRGLLQTYSALHQNVLDVFNEYGVQIMTPAYEGDPSEPKIVPREQWFTPPAKPPAGPG